MTKFYRKIALMLTLAMFLSPYGGILAFSEENGGVPAGVENVVKEDSVSEAEDPQEGADMDTTGGENGSAIVVSENIDPVSQEVSSDIIFLDDEIPEENIVCVPDEPVGSTVDQDLDLIYDGETDGGSPGDVPPAVQDDGITIVSTNNFVGNCDSGSVYVRFSDSLPSDSVLSVFDLSMDEGLCIGDVYYEVVRAFSVSVPVSGVSVITMDYASNGVDIPEGTVAAIFTDGMWQLIGSQVYVDSGFSDLDHTVSHVSIDTDSLGEFALLIPVASVTVDSSEPVLQDEVPSEPIQDLTDDVPGSADDSDLGSDVVVPASVDGGFSEDVTEVGGTDAAPVVDGSVGTDAPAEGPSLPDSSDNDGNTGIDNIDDVAGDGDDIGVQDGTDAGEDRQEESLQVPLDGVQDGVSPVQPAQPANEGTDKDTDEVASGNDDGSETGSVDDSVGGTDEANKEGSQDENASDGDTSGEAAEGAESGSDDGDNMQTSEETKGVEDGGDDALKGVSDGMERGGTTSSEGKDEDGEPYDGADKGTDEKVDKEDKEDKEDKGDEEGAEEGGDDKDKDEGADGETKGDDDEEDKEDKKDEKDGEGEEGDSVDGKKKSDGETDEDDKKDGDEDPDFGGFQGDASDSENPEDEDDGSFRFEEEGVSEVLEASDNALSVSASVIPDNMLPEGAALYVSEVFDPDDGVDTLFKGFANRLSDELGAENTAIYVYRVGFCVDEEPCAVEGTPVSAQFTFDRGACMAANDSIRMGVISDDEIVEAEVNEDGFQAELVGDTFVYVLDSRVLRPVLRGSIHITDGSDDYWISKTTNINNDGTATRSYGNSENFTDTIDMSGAVSVDVVIKYRTESTSYDWLYIKDANNNIITRDADGHTVGDSSGKIGGGGSNTLTPSNTVTYRFENDILKFVWRTDGSVTSYGYYAVITPVYVSSDVPAYHFEELEDGTYALVFDRGGNIDAFFNNTAIKEDVAPYKNSVSEIRFHKDTLSIGTGAFSGLSSLTKVTWPRTTSLTSIGRSAFANCDNLQDFTVPSSVTSIGSTAFSGCVGMTSFTFAPGSQMTGLPSGLFSGLRSLETVVLPEDWTEIPEGAFRDLVSLKNVSLPQNLTEIPANAFNGCTSLTHIDLPSTVTAVKANAFRNTRLTEIPNREILTEVGDYAFGYIPTLTSISVPGNMTTLGKAFVGCANVTDFVFEPEAQFEYLPDNFFEGMTSLRNVTLPSNLKKIGNYMFYNCSNLEHISYPGTVTSIGNYAFQGCKKLQDFEIPAGVTSLGTGAFYDCDSLRDMVIPATVRNVGQSLFYDCNKLLSVTFEDGSPVTTLPSSMFYNCTNLERVKLPDGVTAIPASYFYNCTSLRHVDLPANLTRINDNAFYGCRNLENITFPNTLTYIGSSAFYDCDTFTDVVIPKSVTSIGSSAFSNCSYLRSVVWEENSPMTSLNTYMFYNCSSLETLVLPTNLSYIPDYLAYGCSKLRNVDIPSRVTRIGSYAFYNCSVLDDIVLPETCTQIYGSAFTNSGLTHIELPANLTSIGNNAFQNSKLQSVVIPKNTTSIGSYAFYNIAPLESVVFEEGGKNVNLNSSGYNFAYDPRLSTVEFNDRVTSIPYYAFYNDPRLNAVTVGGKVTSIGSYAYYDDRNARSLVFESSPTNAKLYIDTNNNGYTFYNMNNLEELVIDRDITSNYSNTTNFRSMNQDVHITIGEHVNTLDNMIVSEFKESTRLTFEGENDFSVSTRVANRSTDVKWSELKGDFYVDPNGVLYKLNNSDNTASLFYIPDGITAYTVPETVTSVAGTTYTVNRVDSYVGRSASDLTALTFTNPSGVTIPQFAFTGCSSLQTINDLPELYPEDWAEVSLLCDFPIHTDVQPQQVLTLRDDVPVEGGGDAMFSFGVSMTNQESMADDRLTYVFPTGRSARLDFAISNESNVDMSDRVIRVYFAFTGDNYTFGNYTPGNDYTLVNTSTGARYPFKVRSTDAKGVYYYDITGFRPGDTLAFNNQFSYACPNSAGGDMVVWVESISSAEAAEREGKTSQPNKYIKGEWYTQPVPYNLSKSVLGSPTFEFVSNSSDPNDENIYIKNIQYSISLTSSGASGTNQAKDYIEYIEMHDDLKLTEHLIWNPEMVDAVRSGDYYWSNPYLYVRIGTSWVNLCQINFPNVSYVMDVYPSVVVDDNGNNAIRINWSYRNQNWQDFNISPTADMPATSYSLYVGNRAVEVKQGSDLWRMFREGAEFTTEESEVMRKVANAVDEVSHYSYSADQTRHAEAPERLVYMTTGFNMKKTLDGVTTFGRKHAYNIALQNTGLVHKDDIDIVEDSLSQYYYIKADDMDTMFANSKWGPFLRIDMSSLTLCSKPNKSGTDVYGDAFTITDAQYGDIYAEPYNGYATAGTDGSEVVTNAKFSIYWNDDYTHKVLEVKNDAGEIQNTYTIGEGCDYPTIDAAFKDIGYVVTFRAAYKVTWDVGDKYTLYCAAQDGHVVDDVSELTPADVIRYQYMLKSGRTDTFRIESSIKRTDMMLTEDRPNYYGNNSYYVSNTAYAKDDQGRQVGISSENGYIYQELSLYKSAYANGQSWSSNSTIQIPDDTVIDYSLSFSNNGDKYDVLPLVDRMGGGQVLLVPVRTNRDAVFYANGGDTGVALKDLAGTIDVYSYNGIDYYVLDQTGSYEGVVIDGRIADTIQVTRYEGRVDTLMIWYYQDLMGYNAATGNGTSRSITYKALADAARLGGHSGGDDGSTITNKTLTNSSWLGGHKTHRLYAVINGETEEIYSFIKWIVEDPNDTEHESLIRHSLIRDGNQVLYKMILENAGNDSVVIRGNRIHDELPSTKGIFAWNTDNVLDVYYVTEGLGSTVNTVGPEYWYVNAIQPNSGADTSGSGLYYLRWTNDFTIEMEPKGSVWIYVLLQFPASVDGVGNAVNTWDDFIAANNGGTLTNYFYVDQRQSHVTHELVDIVEGTLQKGVLDSGLSTSSRFQSMDTRHYYQNGANTDNGSVQLVTYYTVLYNSGNVRLYLDPLVDQLPKGFHFRNFANGVLKTMDSNATISMSTGNEYSCPVGCYSTNSVMRYTEYLTGNSSYKPVATVTDTTHAVTYKNARLVASVATDADGREQLTITIGRESNSDSYLKYDSTLGKYYLDPNEAIRFAYNCRVEGFLLTENLANNEIAMPVYDKYGLGVFQSDEDEVTITPATYRDIAVNDGTRDMSTTEEENIGHMHVKSSWVRSTTDWFASNVSMQRLASVPGLLKSIGGESFYDASTQISPNSIYGSVYDSGAKLGTPYIGTIARTSVANWLIKVYNEGGIGSNSMEDFTIVDTVDPPYMFTGNFFYDYYDVGGTLMTTSSMPIFSLGGREANDTVVPISLGSGSNTKVLNGTITVNGPPVYVDSNRATVQLLRDEDGTETIIIRLIDNQHRVPPNTYMALVAHTQYVSSDAVLSKQFYNHAQLEPSTNFDPAMVSQGGVLYRTEDEEEIPYAIESGASVTMTAGYTSAARKQVTETANTSNTGWSDRTKNAIQLPEKFSKFYYDMYVDLPADDPTQKLVMIDALPEVGDHSPFVVRDLRESEFTVHLIGDNPGFRVWSSPDLATGTKVELEQEKWSLEVTTRHEFEHEDWDGGGSGWTLIDLSDGLSDEEIAALNAARSFRIIIDDADILSHPAEAWMGKNHQVQVRFNAELEHPEDADPGAIAWNSFGYRYTIPIGATGFTTSLNAEPLKVGVSIPAVPFIIKNQKTPHDHYRAIEDDSEYRFLVYTGTAIAALNNTSEMTPAQIAAILSDNSRDFTIASITVAGGTSTGRTDYLDDLKKWELSGSDFAETEDHWVWVNSAKYTILELPWEENGFRFDNSQNAPVNNYTFVQNTSNDIVLRVTNVYSAVGNLSVRKTTTGPNFDPDRRFTFTIQLKDGRYGAYGTYNYIGTNIRDGTLTFDDNGIAVIQLKHDQGIEIQNIPVGYTYLVTETEDPCYAADVNNVSGTISGDSVADVHITNTRIVSSLTVSKMVPSPIADVFGAFNFEIYLADGSDEITHDYDAVLHKADGTEESLTMHFVDGIANVALRSGEYVVIEDVPVGLTYDTTEAGVSPLIFDKDPIGESGHIEAEGSAAIWTNTPLPIDVTFSKTVSGNQASRDKYFRFTFTISGVTEGMYFDVDLSNADATTAFTTATLSDYRGQTNVSRITVPEGATSVSQVFYLQHGQSITVSGILPGMVYTVSENPEDYKTNQTNGTVMQEAGTDDVTIPFVNTRNGLVPTGINERRHYMVLLLGLVAIAFAVALRRRRGRNY